MGKYVEGETLTGWGAFRSAPWHFVGIFPDKASAEAAAQEAGPDYEVGYGDNQAGTDNFVMSSLDQPG